MGKPRIEFSSCGPSGNIYYILGMVREELRKQRRYNDYNELRDKVCSSASYTEALHHIRDVVELVDKDGRY